MLTTLTGDLLATNNIQRTVGAVLAKVHQEGKFNPSPDVALDWSRAKETTKLSKQSLAWEAHGKRWPGRNGSVEKEANSKVAFSKNTITSVLSLSSSDSVVNLRHVEGE